MSQQYNEVNEFSFEPPQLLKHVSSLARKRRELDDDYTISQLNLTFRMKILNAEDMEQAYNNSGTALHRSEGVNLKLAQEIVYRAIECINGETIENLFGEGPKPNSISEYNTFIQNVRNKMRLYLSSYLLSEDIQALMSHYMSMSEKKNKIIESVNTSKKA